MKLLAYILNGSTFNPNDGTSENWSKVIGIDLETYNNNDLENNAAFLIISDDEEIPSNYSDISSIENWGKFGETAGLSFYSVRDILKELKISREASTAGFTELENLTLTRYNLINYLKIYDYIGNDSRKNFQSFEDLPLEIDYDILGLHKRQIFVKGDLLEVQYYGNYNPLTQEWSNLIVQEDRIYERENQYLKRRYMTISWIKSDDSVGLTKNTVKYYNILESGKYGITRRSNIFEEVKIVVVYLISVTNGISTLEAETIGKDLLEQYSIQTNLWLNSADEALYNALLADTSYSFLNNVIAPNGTNGYITIRDYILDEITIDFNRTYTMADKSPFGLP